MKFSKYYGEIFLIVVVALSSFFSAFRLSSLMPFIGDQAWFYLSARDIWLRGEIPLVGITSSHTWLHQGPIWTYLLALILPLGRYNPIVPAYFTVFMYEVTGIALYVVAGKLVSKRTALIASSLFLTSPLVVLFARMPYHTTLIPLFTLLLIYSTALCLRGKPKFFAFIFLYLGILYNLELATVIFWVIPILLILFGYKKRTKWFRQIQNSRILILSVILVALPMFPILLYDVSHGFVQTVIFFGWLVARLLYPILPFLPLAKSSHTFLDVGKFLLENNTLLALGGHTILSLLIVLVGAVGYVLTLLKRRAAGVIIIGLFFAIPFTGLILSKTPSGAYLPMLFPSLFMLLGVGFSSLANNRYKAIVIGLFVSCIIVNNLLWLLLTNYQTNLAKGSEVGIEKRLRLATTIIKLADGKKYSLRLKGPGSEFPSSRLNTEYLTWMLGNPPQNKKAGLEFVIFESPSSLTLLKGNSILGVW